MVKISIASVLTLFTAASSLASAAALTKVNNWGTNPTNAEFYIYVPDKLAANPAILVGIHWCTGTASAFFTGTQYKAQADKLGFIVIYPDAPDSGGCWDVHSPETLKHDGGGDSTAIANMVKYTINQYKADASRVFSVGVSSGGMMTEVLMGAYPDLFAAGSSWAGVPFGCFAGSNMWNSQCANGQLSKTGQAWGDQVRAAYPGFTGKRPRVQLWHGTNDETLNFNNFGESIKQWTNVFGVSETPTETTANFAVSGWTRTRYGPNVEAIRAQGQSHNLAHQEGPVISFFGLDQPAPVPTTTSAAAVSTTATTAPPPGTTTSPVQPTTTAGTGSVPKWNQCGGIGFTGGTVCVSGSTCKELNPYYSQ